MLFLAVALGGCEGGGGPAPAGSSVPAALPAAIAEARQEGTPVDPAIVAADNTFGLHLLNALLADNGGTGPNVAISPLSLSLALQVLYNGADGATRAAMAQALDLGGLSDQALNDDNAALQASLIAPDQKVTLTVANSIWLRTGDSPVLPSFTQTDVSYYGATVGDLSGAPAAVNTWVKNETQGLISTLLPPDLPASAFRDAIIANALYFKGTWSASFDPAATAEAPFTLSDGTQVSTPLMHQTSTFPYFHGTLAGIPFQALRIPYGTGRLNMLILMPESGSNLSNFAGALSGTELASWSFAPQAMSIALPRFTSSYSSPLSSALTALGMGIAFTQFADFSALAPSARVSEVYHATVVEVDETGTVAAAATAITITTSVSVPSEMIMDHPFLWAIEDGMTGELLFIGVLANPTASPMS